MESLVLMAPHRITLRSDYTPRFFPSLHPLTNRDGLIKKGKLPDSKQLTGLASAHPRDGASRNGRFDNSLGCQTREPWLLDSRVLAVQRKNLNSSTQLVLAVQPISLGCLTFSFARCASGVRQSHQTCCRPHPADLLEATPQLDVALQLRGPSDN